MVIYLFVWQMLAWSITVAALFPLTILWVRLAHKIWHGHKPIDEELGEQMWQRATLASIALFVAAVLFLFCDWATLDWLEMSRNAGPIHLIYYVGFLAVAAWLMMYVFSMEDYFQGMSITVIYFCIPTALFFVLSLLFDNPLQVYVLKWLIKPTV